MQKGGKKATSSFHYKNARHNSVVSLSDLTVKTVYFSALNIHHCASKHVITALKLG